ncbi:hypothetical protein TVAG_145690 [Trichomonas vaginalis G3]|uniref:Uncharacterized protein n=1 Tax=Trichomonas vaginalis (strain ATCC PRA-98 / G3) TaxID=412133 RepID=A2EFT8_TRIV3|nr:hypothetical protein TVAGG3_0445170 [Trichomonas vaginalis G3]EAY08489.1 hypothetical protein TVAG_145690 [Trichomonas vaginalis G3]KAI5537741.1 hypothetical protein TVAGG3_0445170 [Trichomonas vaginalis G3]|eukprot:XP_001320712.1 hypothetical protein [Trichomonas vaginalis G3]
MQSSRLTELFKCSLKKNKSKDAEIIRMKEQTQWELSLSATNKLSYCSQSSRNRSYSYDDSSTRQQPQRKISAAKSGNLTKIKTPRKGSNTVPTAALTKLVNELRINRKNDPAFNSMRQLPVPTIEDDHDSHLVTPVSSTLAAIDLYLM